MLNVNYKALANPGALALQPYQAGKPIEELQRELGLAHIIKLASNENPLGPSQTALNAAQAALAQAHRYPDSNGYQLKQALAEHLSIPAEQLTLGNGSDNVLALIAQAFIKPAEEMIISQYAFAMFAIIAHANQAKAVITPATNWGTDLNAMLATIHAKTKLIYMANPNNPTATWITQAELIEFLRKVPAHVLVVLDEAYYDYMRIDSSYPDSISLLNQFPQLIITRTFSKAYGLAGLRVGYAIAHPDITEILNRIRLPFNVNAPALAAATAALSDQNHLKDGLQLTQQGLLQLANGCKKMGLDYLPPTANFITVNVGDALKVYQVLLHKGVIVRPLADYTMPEYIRISCGLAKENRQCLAVLQEVLSLE